MKLLYLSAVSSERLINDIYKHNKRDPGFAVQKFNRLLVNGLINNQVYVSILSAPPIGRHNSSAFLWHRRRERENAIEYNYLSFINLPFLRHLCLCIGTFFKTLCWVFKSIGEKRAVVCDVLNASICVSAIFVCKITGTQIVGIMTDMPGLMVSFKTDLKTTSNELVATRLIKMCLRNLDKYLFLTEAMNVVNEKRHPYIVMEGISDSTMNLVRRTFERKPIRTVMYAGGLHERYGLKKLTEAFMLLPQENIRLIIFGSGPFVEDLKEKYCKEDGRIMYMGVKPNEVVVSAELDASLLVNPRPTHEVFTQYSFPSKNIEYMASGTPLLTTKLPGMPVEYYPYVYLIEDETIDGYAKALADALSKSDMELYDFGAAAKKFVLEQKNSSIQALRVIKLIRQ